MANEISPNKIKNANSLLETIKGSGVQICPAIVSGIVTCDAPVSGQLIGPRDEGPYDPTTATSVKTSLKSRLHILLNFFAIIPFCPVT